MTESLSRIPGGTSYYSGCEARLRRRIQETSMKVFDGWSYEEIATPTVDYYSLFERGMGRAEAHRAFRFTDQDGRLLALRPDVTSGIARAAATLFAQRKRPLRFYYAAEVFRQQPQSHALWRRESTQVGCELIGRNSQAADIEVLTITCEVLNRLGFEHKYVITLNDAEVFRGVAENLALDFASREEMRCLIDTRNAADLESFLAGYTSLDESRDFVSLIQLSGKGQVLDSARSVITNPQSRMALARLEGLWQTIESLDLSDCFEVDLGDVSRLDYYTGLTFKVYIEGSGTRIGSGGRYDNLTASFGRAEPAVGFVLNVDALVDLLLKLNPPAASADIDEQNRSVIANHNQTELFRAAIEERTRGKSIVIDPGEVEPCRT
jgi:ATP phosphoribosyltransferase regulatory subunit